MEYKQYKQFMNSVHDLHRRGGPYRRAAEDVQALITRIADLAYYPDPFQGMTLTNHGENRIPKCLKYDLTGYARLITVRHENITLLLFAGTHDACDDWLKRNKGTKFYRDHDAHLRKVTQTIGTLDPETIITAAQGSSTGLLFGKIRPENLFDRLVEGIPRKTVRAIEALEFGDTIEQIFAIASTVEDPKQSTALYDTMVKIRADDLAGAHLIISAYLGIYADIEKLSLEETRALIDSEQFSTIPRNSPEYAELFTHYVEMENYKDWMLFLHPDQKDLCVKDYAGPAKLYGVSGSGKTTVIINRAIALAKKYPGEQVLVLTLNKPLAKLIDDLICYSADAECRRNIKVEPFFKTCQGLLKQFEPENEKLYDEFTWKHNEHIDEIWREFYRCEVNNRDAEVLLPLHDSLISRGIEAEQYIREEFDWIRSATPNGERENYLSIEREGRTYPLDKRFRELALKGLAKWEQKMRDIGVTDYLGITTSVYKHLKKLEPFYRFILVDESQDFGTAELKIIRALVQEGENDLYLAGDATQKISTKHQSLVSAGIQVHSSRIDKLVKNYRNGRHILEFAHELLLSHMTEETLREGDFELMDPEYAEMPGELVYIFEAQSLKKEINSALRFIQDELQGQPEKKYCIAFAGFSSYEIETYGKKYGFDVLNGETDIEKKSIYFSDLDNTKGFEFDTMIILNCGKEVLPNSRMPERERARDLARFYVAMTRAKQQLIISFSVEPSDYIVDRENALPEKWENYLSGVILEEYGIPSHLDQLRSTKPQKDLLRMDAKQLFYSDYGLGLSTNLISKLREKVNGEGLVKQSVPVSWKNMGDLKKDITTNLKVRQQFGPVEETEMIDLYARANLTLL